MWIRLVGEQVRDHGLKIRAIASSEDSEKLGRSYRFRLRTFFLTRQKSRDLTVDGADEVAPGLTLIRPPASSTRARSRCRLAWRSLQAMRTYQPDAWSPLAPIPDYRHPQRATNSSAPRLYLRLNRVCSSPPTSPTNP